MLLVPLYAGFFQIFLVLLNGKNGQVSYFYYIFTCIFYTWDNGTELNIFMGFENFCQYFVWHYPLSTFITTPQTLSMVWNPLLSGFPLQYSILSSICVTLCQNLLDTVLYIFLPSYKRKKCWCAYKAHSFRFILPLGSSWNSKI